MGAGVIAADEVVGAGVVVAVEVVGAGVVPGGGTSPRPACSFFVFFASLASSSALRFFRTPFFTPPIIGKER